MRVAVFLSSSTDVSPMLVAEARELGADLARWGHALVYGGTAMGCMGALAEGALSLGGRLTGVIPQMDFAAGAVQSGLADAVIVPSLSDRKQALIDRADAFVVYPGGLGTLDEALEVLALKSLGTLNKKILFYDFLGVWRPFIDSLHLLYEQRLIRQPVAELLTVLDKRADLREHLIE